MLILLFACVQAPDHEGIAIGNPPSVTARLGPIDGAQATAARMHVSDVTAGCGDELAMITDVGALDLLGDNTLPMPNRSACVLSVGASSALELMITRSDGSWVQGAIALGTVSLMSDDPTPLDGAFVLELGAPGWLNADMLDADAPLEPGSESHGLIVAALRSGSALFPDLDGDGVVAPEERELGPTLRAAATDDVMGTESGDTGTEDDEDEDDDDEPCDYGDDAEG